MKEYVVTYTITTNVQTDSPAHTGVDAIQDGLGYGLGELVAKGEYDLTSVQVAVPFTDAE